MSDFREKQDDAAYEQMLTEEYAPAAVEPERSMADTFVVKQVDMSESHTIEEWRELKIAEKLCPMPGCSGRLDDEWYCSGCGQVSFPKVLPAAQTEKAA